MAGRSPTRFLWLLLFVIPAVFLWFGIDSLLYRMNARALATPMVALVEAVHEESYSCKDSDGNTRTCHRVAYDLRLDIWGEPVRRPLLDSTFDPDDPWHSPDMISPQDYPEGAAMKVLVRLDLDNRVAIDAFWSAYVLPFVLLGFGTFWLLALSVIVPSIMRDQGKGTSRA